MYHGQLYGSSIDHRKVIGTVVSREDYLVPKAGGVFDAEEYDAHPDRYRSTFAEKVRHLIFFSIQRKLWQDMYVRIALKNVK